MKEMNTQCEKVPSNTCTVNITYTDLMHYLNIYTFSMKCKAMLSENSIRK